MKIPNKNPLKFPIANKNPTAVPYPTGKTSSHPSYSMIGTRGIKKNELKAETSEANTSESVYNNG